MTPYDINKANKALEKFSKLTGFNIQDTSRKTEVIALKTLFYYVLNNDLFLNDNQISNFYKTKGIKANRSSIYHSLSKFDMYYKDFNIIQEYYKIYFDIKEISQEEADLKIEHLTLNEDKKALYELLDTLEDNQLKDIREMVNLRVKSYAWKSLDKYEVISCES